MKSTLAGLPQCRPKLMGEPGKYGKSKISFLGHDPHVECHVERFGKQYPRISGDLSGLANVGAMPWTSDIFHFKFFPVCYGSRLESDPILVKTGFKIHYNRLEQGRGQIEYLPADHVF